ncbi:MAG TPA: HAMP domain-containing histidine kinase [Candidatus Aphodovivens avicola]|nr:HAMP domain-containing histidine kinase [Candidatus Aphodovivens avicola]
MSADGKTEPFGADEADGVRQAAGSQPPAPSCGTEGWRPGARWTGQAPVPPDELKKRQRHRRMRGSRGAGALARFFTKQVLWFIFLVFALLIIDVFLYILIAVHEMDRNCLYGTPATVTRTASEQLALEDGVYVLGEDAAAQLDGQGAWAQLIDAGGAVVWSHGVPQASAEAAEEPATDATDVTDGSEATDASGDAPVQDPGSSAEAPAAAAASEASSVADDDGGPVPDAYTLNDIALIAHYHTVKGQPAFIWERPDGLLLVAFPAGTYETMTITWPRETWTSLPTYIGGIIVADLLILFAAYVVYRRRTQRAVEPINDALGALSRGGRAQLDLKGDLAPIADQINETSDILEHKDRAREQWIRGVSHDIRTPLSLIIAKAEGIAADEEAVDATRSEARAIRTQGLKIKDLVADLNAASQLSFSERPLDLERVHLAKLLRSIAASYLNSGLDAAHPLDFDLDDACSDAVVLGDERMLTRLVENLLANARLHNPDGCAIAMTLVPRTVDGTRCAELRVSDDGAGIDPAALAALEERLSRARLAPDDAVPDDAGHGLGLVLVDRIARAHGGSFDVEGSPGAGFSACAVLPLA